MTRSFRCPFVLLVLASACARRERPFVAGAGPLDPGATRLVVKPDGKLQAERGSKRLLLDAPARLRLRELAPAFAFIHGGGLLEIDALVDTEAGPGAVPLRVDKGGGGIGYYENLQPRKLWRALEDGVNAQGALARPGYDGAWKLVQTGSVMSLGLLGEPLTPAPPEPAVTLESATFILLCAETEDGYEDVVRSMAALERRFPGKVALRLPR